MSKKPIVAVVIPVYTNEWSEFEIISFNRCKLILKEHSIFVAVPISLDCSKLPVNLEGIIVKQFPDHFFEGIQGYNRFMLSSLFYSSFLEYDYILISQLDCYIFKDNLLDFCNADYDYIGAPWLPSHEKSFVKTFFRKLKQIKSSYSKRIHPVDRYYQVGNGGLSLRKVSTFLEITATKCSEIDTFLSKKGDLYNEDIFFALYVTTLGLKLHKPSFKVAAQFAIERNPAYGMQIAGGLPFGCHAWYKEPFYSFWRNYISLKC
ncbi:MAG: DUF5672 family protein [Phocaeicola sp.]